MHNQLRPGIGYVVRGRRGGFFKKLFKGVGKVVKAVAPVVLAVAKTAAKHTVVGRVLTVTAAVKKRIAGGGRPSVKSSSPGWNYGGDKEAKSQGLGRYAKGAKRKTTAKRKGGGTAKQRAARARFAKAARKGKIRKGAKL